MEVHEHLKILLFTESGRYIAQCLQFDIAAQGESSSAAIESLQTLFWAQYHFDQERQREPFSRLEKAPDDYWVAFEKAYKIEISLKLPPLPADDTIGEEVRLAA
jgi:hypothetical protein